MLHPTVLDDVGPTCWLRLNGPLHYGPWYCNIVQHRASNIIDLVVTASNVGRCSELSQKWVQHAYDTCIPIQGSKTSHARKNLTSDNTTPPPFFIFVSQHLRNGPNPVYNAFENASRYHRRCR